MNIAFVQFCISVILTSVPWLIGFLFTLLIVEKFEESGDLKTVYAACGGILGLVVFSGLSTFTLLAEIPIFSISGVVIVGACFVIFGIALFGYRFSQEFRSAIFYRLRRSWSLPAFCFLVVIFFLFAYQSSTSPVHAWDVLWYRGQEALLFLKMNLAEEPYKWYLNEHAVHPPFPEILSAWAAFVVVLFDGHGIMFAAWYFYWASFFLIVYSFNKHFLGKGVFALIVAVTCCSTPLIMNHLFLSGYAELLTSIHILATVALLVISMERKSRYVLMFSFLVSFPLLLYKNLGFIYAAIIYSIFFWLSLISKGGKIRLYSVFVLPFLIILFGFFPELIEHADVEFKIGKREVAVIPTPWATVLFNLFQAYVSNGSFGILITLFIFGLSSFTRLVFLARDPSEISVLVPYATGAGVLVFLALTQFTEYGLFHARPYNDTGNSRFSMNAFVLVGLFMPMLLKDLYGHSRFAGKVAKH